MCTGVLGGGVLRTFLGFACVHSCYLEESDPELVNNEEQGLSLSHWSVTPSPPKDFFIFQGQEPNLICKGPDGKQDFTGPAAVVTAHRCGWKATREDPYGSGHGWVSIKLYLLKQAVNIRDI